MRMLTQNPLLMTDGYKLTHWKQYPEGTRHVYSYMESRGGTFPETLQFGTTYIVDRYLSGRFFNRQDLSRAQELAQKYFDQNLFNYTGWQYILNKYDGRLPIKIQAIPEGHVVGTHNVLMTVENTDPYVPWLTNYIESLLLKMWYPITVATLSRQIKQVIGAALKKTGDLSGLPFKLHDFGYRGVSSEESSAIGGAAHLVNFLGTDTLSAVELLHDYYGEDIAGFSIPASEHSTITAWGGPEKEVDAQRNMLKQYPKGLVASVSDSYDLENAVRNIWGDTLRDEIISRQGTLVIRPDSGEPTPTLLKMLDIAWERFGGETNSKGYKVLVPSVRFIWGDGINYHSINQIVRGITDAGWSMDNLAFGMGGALLQQLNRDTQRFAFKASAINIDGKWLDVYKNPKTDPTKRSKKGRFKVSNASGKFTTLSYPDGDMYLRPQPGEMLETILENGEMKYMDTLATIRARAASYDSF